MSCFSRNTIIVFTGKDEFDANGKSVEEVLEHCEALRKLVQDCDGRYVFFNNKASAVENQMQVSCLLQTIRGMNDGRENKFFESDIYDVVETILKQELRKKALQITETHEKKFQQLLAKITELKEKIELVNSQTGKQEELEQLNMKLDDANKQYQKATLKMNTVLSELREEMKTGIDGLAGAVVLGATIGAGAGGATGGIFGLGIGAAFGLAVGGALGATIGGFVQHVKQRKKAIKRQEAIDRYECINREVAEVLLDIYSKQAE